MRKKKFTGHIHSSQIITKKSQITGTRIQEFMLRKEKDLGYRCKKVWNHESAPDRNLIYGLFDDGTKEGLIVTLGYAEPRMHNMFVPMDFAGGSF